MTEAKKIFWTRTLIRIRRAFVKTGVGFMVSIALAFVYYIIWSAFFLTDEQKRIKTENDLLNRTVPQVQEKVNLLSEEMDFLMHRDINVYKQVFSADMPSVSNLLESSLLSDDQIEEKVLIKRNMEHSKRALAKADSVEAAWRAIFDTLCHGKSVRPPLVTPVKGLSHTNIGASVGDRMNPFYKLKVRHDGIDIIAPANTPVYATMGGYVTNVSKSAGGRGNMVEITHTGGYVTRYAHLAESVVKKGRYVKAGALIGYVGDSGRSFATHLHYEIHRDSLVFDPVHHFFGSIGPDEYIKMQIMSLSSGQSMD